MSNGRLSSKPLAMPPAGLKPPRAVGLAGSAVAVTGAKAGAAGSAAADATPARRQATNRKGFNLRGIKKGRASLRKKGRPALAAVPALIKRFARSRVENVGLAHVEDQLDVRVHFHLVVGVKTGHEGGLAGGQVDVAFRAH